MCHTPLLGAKIRAFLVCIDEEPAQETRAGRRLPALPGRTESGGTGENWKSPLTVALRDNWTNWAARF
jgi:hypothetical protein